MEDYLDTIDEFFAKYKALQPLKAEDKARLDKKFRLEFNYNSNHIEGNTLTYGETELLLMFDDTMGNHSMREYEETKAHDVAFHVVEQFAKDAERPLTEQFIKELNETILVRPYWKDAITPDGQPTRRQIKVGEYKEFPNSVRLQNGEMFHYASPAETPIKMQELIDWYRTEEQTLHPVALAAMLHYKFVRVHPFDDGNGRISRLLMNYVLLKFNYPPVIIKSADKDNYLRALHLADVGDFDAFVSYVAKQVVWSLEVAVKAANGESLDEKDDFKKEIELIKRKASSKDIPKSPKVVYETFVTVKNVIWGSILNALEQFDPLFNEAKDIHTVNGMDQKFKVRQVPMLDLGILGTKEVSDEPEGLEVFGYNVYDWDINDIGWQHTMFGLRGGRYPTDIKITVGLLLNNFNYDVRLKADSIVVYETEVRYKDKFLPADIDKITDVLKKHLIELIKTKID